MPYVDDPNYRSPTVKGFIALAVMFVPSFVFVIYARSIPYPYNLAFFIWPIACYWLGYEDGKGVEQENNRWRK